MFFEEHEKAIYSPPNSDKKYDPLRVDRLLMIETDGRLGELISHRNAVLPDESGRTQGDISADGMRETRKLAAMSEVVLADAARKIFGLPSFPEYTDGEVLEVLYHFLEWMKGKGTAAGTPQ